MNIVISQPRYLPALNYLQRLKSADLFVILDTVQRQSRGWENRNKLLLPDPQWVTIPIASSSRAKLIDTKIRTIDWIEEHKSRIERCYSGAPFFDPCVLERYYDIPKKLFAMNVSFVELMICLIKNASKILDFEPKIILASEIIAAEDSYVGPYLLKSICEKIPGVSAYISGPNGLSYGVCDAFAGTSIDVLFHEYNHPIYFQGRQDFVPYMGFLDAIFNCGAEWVSEHIKQALVLEKHCAKS